MITMVGSCDEVASQYPRVFLQAIRHAVIATILQASLSARTFEVLLVAGYKWA